MVLLLILMQVMVIVDDVFRLLIPDEVATVEGRPVRNATAVHDMPALAAIIGEPVEDLLAGVPSFELDGTVMASLRPRC